MGKVLLVISDYKNGFPYIQDLERELKTRNVFVDVVDVGNLFVVNNDGNVSKVSDSFIVKLMLRIPKVRTYTRKLLLKSYLKSLREKYDAVGIHSCDETYINLIYELRAISQNLSVTIWGSDFYRATNESRQKKRIILDQCDLIVFGNPSNQEDFLNYYKSYNERTFISGFGVTKFDIIEKELNKANRKKIKQRLGIPDDKYIIAVGYNGTPGQQHERLINCLCSVTDTHKEKIFLLLQMSYGGTETYKKNVERKAKECGIPYKLFDHFLTDEETSRIRIATDIVLNAQVTDGFSASIQEHIYAKNIVIVGEWIRYTPLDNADIFYLKSSEEDFGRKLEDVIVNYDQYCQLAKNNADKIYQLSSWNNRISDWISIYDGTIKAGADKTI